MYNKSGKVVLYTTLPPSLKLYLLETYCKSYCKSITLLNTNHSIRLNAIYFLVFLVGFLFGVFCAVSSSLKIVL